MSSNRLIIISAPSGTGKTSVIRRLLKTYPNMLHSVSCTTRAKRLNEVEGEDYHFISRELFEEWIRDNKFVEWAKVHNEFYGTPKEPLDRALAAGNDIILDLDVEGGMALKKIYKETALTLFLLPPSVAELERRLSERGTDSAEVRQIRLENARHELAQKEKYDFRIINDNLEHACQEIEKILKQAE